MKKLYAFLTVSALLFSLSTLHAQDDNKGTLSAGFETNSTVYVKDTKVGSLPEDHFGSNNYLKLDYTKGRFSAGIQMEGYLPVLQGFPVEIQNGKDFDITMKYVSWQDRSFTVTAGDFFDQFGNGLIFRSWEDRALGFNNSIEGARISWNWENKIVLKGLWGRPRWGMEKANAQVRGIDAIVYVSDLLDLTGHTFSLEGSYVNRYQRLESHYMSIIDTPNSDAYSARLNYDYQGFHLAGEFVKKTKDLYSTSNMSDIFSKRGSALFAEAGYSGSGFGVIASFRRLEYMRSTIYRDNNSEINMINYLPSLTQQNTYMLASLEPYNTRTDGEIGGQLDFFYNFKRGTALGGKRGTKLHLNAALFYSLDKDNPDDVSLKKGALLYNNINADIEKWWNTKFRTQVFYSFQEYIPNTTGGYQTYKNHVIVADLTYKFTPKTSLRVEGQYLINDDYYGDWFGVLAELSFAPRWSIFASDMYNHGNDNKDDRIHYYSAGFSYTYSKTRVAFTYGRNREGYVCSGGVCRYMPGYTGLNLAMTISF